MPTKLCLPPPSEKQKQFMLDKHKNVGFGGSRGGGKSFAVREKSILACLKYPGLKCMIVRKTYPELTANHIEPMSSMLKVGTPGSIATYNKSEKEMRFINGSKILFRYCDKEADADRYQGTEVDLLFLDEATQLSESQIKKLTACVRGTNGYPKRIYYTCNPGGISHGYIKRIFIDGKYEEGEDASEYSFIQSSLFDNKVLMATQPDYLKQLEALPPKLRDAWLYGRWDVFQGAYFEEFRDSPDVDLCHTAGIETDQALIERRYTHVIEPFDIPKDWKVYRSYDWGYGRPFACTYYAVDYEGCAYMFLEVYGCTKTPNEGVKWSNKQQFEYLAKLEAEHPQLKGRTVYGVADPSIWDGSHGISAAEEADKNGVFFEPGDNARVPGWMQVRERLKFDKNGYPMLYIFKTCVQTIRVIPLMMFDDTKVEDLNTDLEDHIPDTIRYFCMMRPIAPRAIQTEYIPISDPLNQLVTAPTGKWAQYKQVITRR